MRQSILLLEIMPQGKYLSWSTYRPIEVLKDAVATKKKGKEIGFQIITNDMEIFKKKDKNN